MATINNSQMTLGETNFGNLFLKNILEFSKKELENELESLFTNIGQNNATPEQNAEIQIIIREIDRVNTLIEDLENNDVEENNETTQVLTEEIEPSGEIEPSDDNIEAVGNTVEVGNTSQPSQPSQPSPSQPLQSPNLNTTNQNIQQFIVNMNALNNIFGQIFQYDDEDSYDSGSEELDEEMQEFLKPVPVPVPEEMMEKLQIKTYNSEMGYDKCSVCFENFLDSKIIKSKVRELACGHIYHADCVDEWLKKHPTCPVCSADQRVLLKQNKSS